MSNFCTACGTVNPVDARFCNNCGTAMAVAALDTVEPEVIGVTKDTPSQPQPSIEATNGYAELPPTAKNNGQKRNWLVIGAAAALLLLVALLYFFLFVADDIGSGNSNDVDTAAEPAAAVATSQMFAMTEANIRDKASTVGSNIIGKFPRGSALTGVLKVGEENTSDWFELADGKGFVAAVNLIETEPPVLVKTLGDKIWTADGAIEIWAQPDSGTLIDRVGEGAKLTLAGLTANDYIEIKLSKGGVGYIADGAAILARSNGRPIAISFNPATCNFGGELDGEFAKIGARLRAQWTALEDKEFVDDEAREKAYNASEGKSSFVRLPRSFGGLTLTAIAQHFESQSLYFSDPPEKVIEAFRVKGFRIGRDGTFPSTELYAGISATRGEGVAYGKSELGCGV